ncbi:hypothetical protein JMJ35_007341 [Cladonia borealis]|uniref:Uncharacterized protein n=1 Tax=Cladonia borealis TaxID=184061 RepID=A0AA39QVE8_9LECA|nr:hypothetical protein JMJ35_007341 [Cladonia borealis]
MSGLMNKVKDALSGTDKQGTGPGLENEHGTQSGVHDTPIGGSGSSVSPTNPGILHSTERGIHGDRDPGVSAGSGLSNQGTAGQSALGGGSGAGYDDTTTTTRDSGLGRDNGLSAGPQFTGTGERDAGLVQSGVDSTRREGGGGVTGSGYDDTRGTGLTGTGSGSGYDDTRGTGLGGDSGTSAGPQYTGTGRQDAGLVQSGVDSTRREGGGGVTGSGYDDTRGTGLTGNDSGYDNTRDLSGNTGAGYDSGSGVTGTGYNDGTSGTGTTGSRYDSGITGSGGAGDSGIGGNTSSGTGLTGRAEQYVEGSEQHHPGDGHPEDIVHPGPHETMTAKALDPHLNQ